MGGIEEMLLTWFSSYAYEPYLVYTGVVCLMVASSFGLPFPEEVTLLSVGLLAYMGTHPDLFPPPYPGAQSVNVHFAAFLCFFSVLLSDFLVFFIGKNFGEKVLRSRFMTRFLKGDTLDRVQCWTSKHGYWACGIFRFTPGLRFPGHLACGIMKIPTWKFLAIDGTAALLTVPTQVYLIAYYGETILQKFKEFKVLILIILAVVGIFLIARKYLTERNLEPSQ